MPEMPFFIWMKFCFSKWKFIISIMSLTDWLSFMEYVILHIWITGQNYYRDIMKKIECLVERHQKNTSVPLHQIIFNSNWNESMSIVFMRKGSWQLITAVIFLFEFISLFELWNLFIVMFKRSDFNIHVNRKIDTMLIVQRICIKHREIFRINCSSSISTNKVYEFITDETIRNECIQ